MNGISTRVARNSSIQTTKQLHNTYEKSERYHILLNKRPDSPQDPVSFSSIQEHILLNSRSDSPQ